LYDGASGNGKWIFRISLSGSIGAGNGKPTNQFRMPKKIPIYYKGKPLKKYFKADFLCFDHIIVELKSTAFMHQTGESQLINYLKATNFKVGLLINFGESSLQWKRFINTY